MPLAEPVADAATASPPAAVILLDSAAQGFDPAKGPDLSGKVDLGLAPRRCPAATDGEIVVCAVDPETFRLRPIEGLAETPEGLPRAEFGLGGNMAMDVHLEKVELPGGIVSNRVMVGVKLKF